MNPYDGTERWKRQVTGSVTALSMTPGGSIIAGTETGNIAGLNANGNLSWSYSSNPENRQSAGITCSAVSDKGASIAAGTADGKILFLNTRGELAGSYNAHEYIRHIAMSADGSVVVAASDDRVYAFSPSSSLSLPVPTPSQSRNGTVVKNTTAQSPTQTPVTLQSRQGTPTATMTELPTTYSVIRTATRSPSALITLLLSLALAMVLFSQRR